MFVIFLGIIPVVAILALLSYYARHNIKLTWKKSPVPYVTNSLSSCWQHVMSACKGVGTAFSKQQIMVPSEMSKNEDGCRKNNIEIKKTALISTTNTDGISRSNTIGNDYSRGNSADGVGDNKTITQNKISFKNIKGLRLSTNLSIFKTNNSADATCDTPQTCETLCSSPDLPSVSVKDLADQFNR